MYKSTATVHVINTAEHHCIHFCHLTYMLPLHIYSTPTQYKKNMMITLLGNFTDIPSPSGCRLAPIMSPSPLITSSASLTGCGAPPDWTEAGEGSRRSCGDPRAPRCLHTSFRNWTRCRLGSSLVRWDPAQR